MLCVALAVQPVHVAVIVYAPPAAAGLSSAFHPGTDLLNALKVLTPQVPESDSPNGWCSVASTEASTLYSSLPPLDTVTLTAVAPALR